MKLNPNNLVDVDGVFGAMGQHEAVLFKNKMSERILLMEAMYAELHNLPVIALRLIAAFIAGGIIGWERETYLDLPVSHRGSIFRLYALVCFGSCMFTIAGVFGFSTPGYISDRIAAQVVSGVGFLGAGTILTDRQGTIRGLPTAAGIWVSASIGLLIGTGHLISGFLGTCLAYIIMVLPHWFPKFFIGRNMRSDHSEVKEENGKDNLN